MKVSRLIPALGAFFVLAVGITACGSGIPGNSVADMAGNPISVGAFNHWMYVAAKSNAAQSPGAPVIVPNDPPTFTNCIAQARKQIPQLANTPAATLKTDCNQLFQSLSSRVMEFLITSYWYQAEAARQNVKISDAQVQKVFASEKNQQFRSNAEFQAFLNQSGQTLDDIIYRVRVSELVKQLRAKHPATVTPAQIAAYYKSHPSQFGTPETRDIRIVRTNDPKQAAAAKAALDKGESWSSVASKYSVDTATKSKGGQLTGVGRGQEERALDEAAFSAPTGKVLGPIHGTFGYYVFEVTKVNRSTQQSLAQATPLIRQILQGQAQTTAQNAVDNQARKNWLHRTKCRTLYAMNDCAG
ncbi:MAG: peptidyl-prolyl cis-trans isomerase, partial [Solirubrobacterales bacterium]|nr:peptidyl-prolyl cis-trans isomerase [Solirubrobacterales bacterium]